MIVRILFFLLGEEGGRKEAEEKLETWQLSSVTSLSQWKLLNWETELQLQGYLLLLFLSNFL